jgi:hypothetical protein
MEDIELLIMAGKPLYGEARFIELLGEDLPAGYSYIMVKGAPRFIIGDPGAHYIQARKKIGFKKVLDFLPFEPET